MLCRSPQELWADVSFMTGRLLLGEDVGLG